MQVANICHQMQKHAAKIEFHKRKYVAKCYLHSEMFSNAFLIMSPL